MKTPVKIARISPPIPDSPQVTYGRNAVDSRIVHAAAQSFFGVLKRECVNRRQDGTCAEARADIFDSTLSNVAMISGSAGNSNASNRASSSSLTSPWK